MMCVLSEDILESSKYRRNPTSIPYQISSRDELSAAAAILSSHNHPPARVIITEMLALRLWFMPPASSLSASPRHTTENTNHPVELQE